MISVGFYLYLTKRLEAEDRKRRNTPKRMLSFDSEWRIDRRENEAWFELCCDCEDDDLALGITHAYAEQSHYGEVHCERA